jgi:hypothetical protein
MNKVKTASTTLLLALALVCAMAWGASAAASRADAKGEKVDRIVIEKGARTMTLMSGGKALEAYKVALGGEPKGAKEREGEQRAMPRQRQIRRRDAGATRGHCGENCAQQISFGATDFVSECGGSRAGAQTRREARGSGGDSRTGGEVRLGGGGASREGLDGWVHRGDE